MSILTHYFHIRLETVVPYHQQRQTVTDLSILGLLTHPSESGIIVLVRTPLRAKLKSRSPLIRGCFAVDLSAAFYAVKILNPIVLLDR